MPGAQQFPGATAPANGVSVPHDLFALTDEQILEIEPDAQDVEVASGPPPTAQDQPCKPDVGAELVTSSVEPPSWLAAQMKDPWTGEEAKELWNGIVQARKEAADYRAAFATPEDARAAKELYPGGANEARSLAERARTLDDIDRAYFGSAGNSAEQTSASRAQLAATMLKEDPAAFREMVFAGLRALEQAGVPPASGGAARSTAGASAAATPAPQSSIQTGAADRHARVAAYATFEKAANDDLERTVGAAIERTLEQALPNAGRTDSAQLKGRLSTTIRQDVESALKGDRQLGEQVAQILAGRRLDSETRAQIVRLIGERAQQVVPTATKRVLNDWTQTTLTAHRGNSSRGETASASRELPAPASTNTQQRRQENQQGRREPARTDGRNVDYRKLSDEQIVEL